MDQGCLIPNQRAQHSRPFEMRLIPNNLQPIALILLSCFLASNSAAADDKRIHIQAKSTSTMVQFCSTEETCQFIRFSAISPKETRQQETKPTQEPDHNSNLIEHINVQLFGF